MWTKTVAPALNGAKKLRDLHNAWFSDDPFALPGEEKGKLAVLKDAEKWSTNVGHPGTANPAEGEIFSTFVLPGILKITAVAVPAKKARKGKAVKVDGFSQAPDGVGDLRHFLAVSRCKLFQEVRGQ